MLRNSQLFYIFLLMSVCNILSIIQRFVHFDSLEHTVVKSFYIVCSSGCIQLYCIYIIQQVQQQFDNIKDFYICPSWILLILNFTLSISLKSAMKQQKSRVQQCDLGVFSSTATIFLQSLIFFVFVKKINSELILQLKSSVSSTVVSTNNKKRLISNLGFTQKFFVYTSLASLIICSSRISICYTNG